MSPGLLLQEIQIYPGGKLLLGNWEIVDLRHVCCNLSVVKHQMKREEAGFGGEGATRGDTLSTRKCVMSGEFRLNHSEMGGGGWKCLPVSNGRGHRDTLSPGTGENRVSDERVGSGVCEQTSYGTCFGSTETRPFSLHCDFSPGICG